MATDSRDLLRQIKKLTDSFEALCLVASYKCSRNTESGGIQEVTIRVYDAGPDRDPSLRYSVEVTTDDGKSTTGNPDSSIELALAGVHWYDLDD